MKVDRHHETLSELVRSFEGSIETALIHHNGYRTFTYTYQEVFVRSSKVASFYKQQGIQKGDRIAIWGPNSPQWAVAYLAAQLSGITVVPIDIQMKSDVVKSILQHAGVRLILQSKFRRQSVHQSCFELEDILFLSQSFDAEKIPTSVVPDDLAVLVYTSGTTGNPKGVMLTHKNICTNINDLIGHYSFDTTVRVLSVLPLSHMLEQTGGFLLPLTLKGTIVYPRAVIASALFDAFKRFHITHMIVVPRLLQSFRTGILSKAEARNKKETLERLIIFSRDKPLWIKKILFSKIHKVFGKSFQFFVSGGASLDTKTAEFWEAVGMRVYQGYGLTETSPVLTAGTPSKPLTLSVGTPLPSVQIRIAEDGEITAKGESVFKGYFNDQQNTDKTFNEGWFMTGDIGAFDVDNNLIIKGRKKEMIVTSSGMNVYPDDIEPVLLRDARVSEACVVGCMRGGREVVHAVMILKNEGEEKNRDLLLAEIVSKANQELSTTAQILEYSLWPEREFPKTTTLKTKRSYVANIVSQKKSTIEDSKQSSPLVEVLASLTGKPASQISPKSVLVQDLGLDSLGRVELIAAIAREFNFELSESFVTHTTTVAELETIVKERRVVEKESYSPVFWVHKKFFKPVRAFLMESTFLWFPRVMTRLRVHGGEHLQRVKGPVIFVSNHVSYFDFAEIYRALPYRFRYALVAPSFPTFYVWQPGDSFLRGLSRRFLYWWGVFATGLYLLAEDEHVELAMRFTGKVVDEGQSVMIFPEGGLTKDHSMQPLKKGVAHMIQTLQIPVIPIGHRGLEEIFPKSRAFPKFGTVHLNFGTPIYFSNETSQEITDRLAKEIDRLRQL